HPHLHSFPTRRSSDLSPLVPERLARFQHVCDARLRLLRAEELKNRLALEIEDVLLGGQARRTVAAAEYIGHRVADAHIVRARLSDRKSTRLNSSHLVI